MLPPSTASATRTSGSSASSTLPRVKPISGRSLSPTHCSEIARTCARTTNGSSARVVGRNVMASLFALFIAERTSCHFLPLNASPGRSMIVSSAICTVRQPACEPPRRRRR